MKSIIRDVAMVVFFVTSFFITEHASGQVLVESNFDTDAEGWTAITVNSACVNLVNPTNRVLNWNSSGGVPGGYIRYFEPIPGNGRADFLRAPVAYHGDLSAAYGGSLTFEQRFFTFSRQIFYASDDVYIQSGSMTLIAALPNPSRDSWGQTQVPLLPGYWRLNSCSGPMANEAEILSVLSDVTELYIRAEQVNSNANSETIDLDRVVLDATPVDESCIAVWEERDDAEPTGRWRHTVAVDTDRGVMVLFGGNTGESDTWEFDLSTEVWTRKQPAISPSNRVGHAMVYDRARQKIVMTGGRYLNKRYKEVWEYDVATGIWEQREDLKVTRVSHAMAYDTLRETTVLYGGISQAGLYAVDVMERSSASDAWNPRSAEGNPGLQFANAMAYDEVRNRIVHISTGSGNVFVDEWNGLTGTWDRQSFAGDVPASRKSPTLVYDEDRQRVVLVGGQGRDDTWEYDGSVWVRRANINPSGEGASGGRDEHAGAYDPVNNRVLLMGGILYSATPQRDMLAFDGVSNTWSTVWAPPAMGPRDLFGMAYDEVGQQIIAYGGGLVPRADANRRFGSGTFGFDGNGWSVLGVTGAPGPRWAMPLVYDSTLNSMLMYGGKVGSGNGTAASSLWELDLGTLEWIGRGLQIPGQRFNHAAAYDRIRQQMVVYGGLNQQGQRLGDTWIYDPSAESWSTLSLDAVSPGFRHSPGMAFDDNRGVIVLFGGVASLDGNSGFFDNSTWEWDGTQWADVTPESGNPPARFGSKLIYDPVRKTVLMYGGMTNFNATDDRRFIGRAYEDLWEWDGLAWKRVIQDTALMPIARTFSNATYDVARSRFVHFGGGLVTQAQYINGQTWDLILPAPQCGPCPADLTGDGIVDFFDVSAFLQLFNNQDPAGDLTNDGIWDFFDISAFLQDFAVGCP